MYSPVDVVLTAAGMHVELAAHAVDPPFEEPVLDFGLDVDARLFQVDVAGRQPAQMRGVRQAVRAAASVR